MITIKETFVLPSKGLVYEKPINPEITLRSMSTVEECLRAAPTTEPYKVMSDIIQACIVGQAPMNVYDMCLPDYEFLLHKLRTVSYGTSYPMVTRCPDCGEYEEQIFDLSTLECIDYDEAAKDKLTIKLEKTGNVVELNYVTPRMLDAISNKNKELMKKNLGLHDQTYLLTIQALIKKVDNVVLPSYKVETFVQGLYASEGNDIIDAATAFNNSFGINTRIKLICGKCGYVYPSTFRTTSEFFRPTKNR